MNKFQERSNERRVEDSSLYIAAGDRDERHALISTDGVSASFWNSEDHNAIESKNSTRLILTPENRADVLLGIKQNGVSTYHRLFGQHSTKFDYPGALILSKTTDISGTVEKDCALKIGNPKGLHLEFDGNEIMCKETTETETEITTEPQNLYINSNGGDVYLASNSLHVASTGNASLSGSLTVSGWTNTVGLTSSASVIVNNGIGFRGYDSNGDPKTLIHINGSNNVIVNGNTSGNTYINGGTVYLQGAVSAISTITSAGAIKSTGGAIIANNCTTWDGGQNGGFISVNGRLGLVSHAADGYPNIQFVVNKSTSKYTQLRSTNSSGAYTVTLPAASGTLALSSSDIRLKENINPTQVKALDVLNKINLYEYDWKSEGREGSPHWSVGMVADQIEPLDKNLVSGGGFYADGTMNVKTIDTFYLCGYIVKSIQEISKEIENIKERL